MTLGLRARKPTPKFSDNDDLIQKPRIREKLFHLVNYTNSSSPIISTIPFSGATSFFLVFFLCFSFYLFLSIFALTDGFSTATFT